MIKNFYNIRNEMITKQDIALAELNLWNFKQQKTLALRSADIKMFSAEEISIISHVISDFRNMTASQISALSHEFLGWQAVDIGEEIPYEIALVSTVDLSKEEWEYPENITLDLSTIGISQACIVA